MKQFSYMLIFVLVAELTLAAAPTTEVAFLIASQDTSYHRQLSANLRNDISQQAHAVAPDYVIHVSILHEIFKGPGHWDVLTALPYLADSATGLLKDSTKWIILCEDTTRVALQPLLTQLSRKNHTKALYLGYPLHDHEASITHHFAFYDNPGWFPYPMLRSGVVFTATLLQRTAAALLGKRKSSRSTEFAIDGAYELARFIMENVQDASDKRLEDAVVAPKDLYAAAAAPGKGDGGSSREAAHRRKHFGNVRKMILQRAPFVCPRAATVASPHPHGRSVCAMHAQAADVSACVPVKRDQMYFAIKTYHKFHRERIPFIEATWAQYAVHRRYFSDVADADIPTIDSGVANVEAGHCAKTLAILKLALKDIKHMQRHLNKDATATIRWIFLSDDDTMLSVAGLGQILGCFNHSEPIYLGERYGFRLHAEDGFSYITGGGGIALSLPTVRLILEHCSCPLPTAPDDMILGACLHSLQVKAIHSARFHQARPNDYPAELLAIEPPISFHKFWQLDPVLLYEQWFAAADRQLLHLEGLQEQQQPQVAPTSNCRRSSEILAGCERPMQEEALSSASCFFTSKSFAHWSSNFYHVKDEL